MRKYTIGDMQAVAASRGGHCISTEYKNTDGKLRWKCAEGHTWEAVAGNVIRGSWCPECARKKLPQCKTNITISDMHAIAAIKGGKCLSDYYKNNSAKLLWECSEGHRWEAPASSIKQGSWCPHCYKENGRPNQRKYSIEDMRAVANSRGGRCLSTKFISINHPLLWECAEGHNWEIPASNILQGSWCPHCYNEKKRRLNRLKYTIEDMQAIAASRGGRCRSHEYRNTNSKLTWECSQGHQWEAIPGNVLAGKWCPHCNSLISESICRTILEHIFGHDFKKCRPKWLRNPDGNPMELDGFSPKLNIAFEYQGHYHYQPRSQKAADIKAHERTKYNDKEKRKVIDQINKSGGLAGKKLKLVTIEKFKTGIKPQEAINHIVDTLLREDIQVPAFDQNIDFSKVYQYDRTEEARSIIEAKGGKLISGGITTCDRKIQVQCEKGHRWWTLAYTIKQGNWCPDCAKILPHTIDKLHSLAVGHGGKCLATSYTNNHAQYTWECAKGHTWDASYKAVAKGSWCPHCNSNAKLTLSELQTRAAQKGGKCLATVYVNARTKYPWECANGHRWEATPDVIKQGYWCPHCAETQRRRRHVHPDQLGLQLE